MGWDKKDTQNYSGDSIRKINEAEHDARDDAAAAGELEERNLRKVSDSPEGEIIYKVMKAAGLNPSAMSLKRVSKDTVVDVTTGRPYRFPPGTLP